MAGRTDLEHKAAAPARVGCYVITVSDTRTEDTDTGGRAIVDLLSAAGHEIVGRTIVKYEAVTGMLWKRLDGFGELFRMLSYQQIGAAAMMSRAVAGTIAGRVIVALPGSEAAVRLAVETLIVPELGHLVREAGR